MRHRSAFPIVVTGFVVAVFSTGCTKGIWLQADPGRVPGIVIDEYGPGRNEGDTSSVIRVSSVGGYSGWVNLSATCCRDVIGDRMTTLPPGTWGLPFSATTVDQNNAATGRVRLITGYGSSPGPGLQDRARVPYGKYLLTLTGTGSGNVTNDTTIAFTVLPEIGFTPSCTAVTNPSGHPAAFNANESSRIVLQARIKRVEQNPTRTSEVYAVYGTPRPDAVRMRVEDSNFERDSALVILEDSVTFEKEVATGCVPAAQRRALRVQGGQSGSMVIRRPTDRTLVLRKPECNWTLGVCLSTTWVDVLVFADEGFWDAFGGKTLRFVWLSD